MYKDGACQLVRGSRMLLVFFSDVVFERQTMGENGSVTDSTFTIRLPLSRSMVSGIIGGQSIVTY